MNLTEEKLTGINIINTADSLNAPLLEIKITNNIDTTIPVTDDLIIYVDKEETVTEDRKQYVFTLNNFLRYLNNTSDEFIIKSEFKNDKVEMKAFVKRMVSEDGLSLLTVPQIEELEYQTITLFEGINYIYTNYSDVDIEAVYPKNNDLNNRFLSNSMFNEHLLNTNELSIDDLYFKDAFTKTENGINMSANNIEVNCISSKDNKFSMDSEGNLSVNSISSTEAISAEINYGEIFDLVYPVGSIYFSINSTNPSILFGGTWQEWGNGKVPVGVDSTQTEFDTVEKTGGHKNLQSHNHTGTTSWGGGHEHSVRWRGFTLTNNVNGAYVLRRNDPADPYQGTDENAAMWSGEHDHSFTTANTGNGNSQNLQPYITCYMWKRTL